MVIFFGRHQELPNMATYPIPPDEEDRLNLLHALNILDTPSEEAFDRMTRLVALILGKVRTSP